MARNAHHNNNNIKMAQSWNQTWTLDSTVMYSYSTDAGRMSCFCMFKIFFTLCFNLMSLTVRFGQLMDEFAMELDNL